MSFRPFLPHAVLLSAALWSAPVMAHECHTTVPVGSVQGSTVTLFQTIVEDWQVVRDRIAERTPWVEIEWLDADAATVHTEMVSLRRTAQIEQRVVDQHGQQWNILWQLADHHGDCTELRAEIAGSSADAAIPAGFAWWAPVQASILRGD